jgi:GNAT superfamily N-acetyltransferase
VTAESIHAFLRAAGSTDDRQRIGPFVIRLTPNTDHPMLNYAVPDDDARPSAVEVEGLVKAFENRGLLPRLEYVGGGAPHLEAILHEQGFSTEAHLSIMSCRPGEERLAPVPPGFELVLARSDEEHTDAIAVADRAYGEPDGPPDRRRVEARKQGVHRGGEVVLVRHLASGAPAASGLFPVPCAGVTELAAVGTAPAFRRQGLAGAVTSRLAARAFESGLRLVWLTPEGPEAERIYARAGFHRAPSHMIHISRRPRA